MRNNLLKLIATATLATLISGCGSSGCSGEGCDTSNAASGSTSTSDNTSASGSTDSSNTSTSTDSRQCTYTITNPITTLEVGEDFNATAVTATAIKGDGSVATTPTISGVDDVDTTTAGTYTITFASTDCDNTDTTTVTVTEPASSGSQLDGDILPF